MNSTIGNVLHIQETYFVIMITEDLNLEFSGLLNISCYRNNQMTLTQMAWKLIDTENHSQLHIPFSSLDVSCK